MKIEPDKRLYNSIKINEEKAKIFREQSRNFNKDIVPKNLYADGR